MSEDDALVADWDLSAAYCAPVADNTNLNRLQDILHRPVVLNAKKRKKAVEDKELIPAAVAGIAKPPSSILKGENSEHGKPGQEGRGQQQEEGRGKKKAGSMAQAEGNEEEQKGKQKRRKRKLSEQLADDGQQEAAPSASQQPDQAPAAAPAAAQAAGDRKRKTNAVDESSAQQQEKRQGEADVKDQGTVAKRRRKKKQQEGASGQAGEEQAQQAPEQHDAQQRPRPDEDAKPSSKGGKQGKLGKASGQQSREQEAVLKARLQEKWEQRQQKVSGGPKPAADGPRENKAPGEEGEERGPAGPQKAGSKKKGPAAAAGEASGQAALDGAHSSQHASERTPGAKAAGRGSPAGAPAAKAGASSAGPAAKAAGRTAEPAAKATASASKAPAAAASSSLIDKMMARLQGGRFRSLNEQLYTQSGADALSMMQGEPELFQHYHEGFQQQTLGWPKLPVDVAIKWLGSLPPSLVCADFGCGDAKLMTSVKQKVHSFDLVSSAPGVIACNMADVPLDSASVDVAIFSLALMGTDYGSFIKEACRVLKPGGWLWIAEVRSRFSGADGKESFKPFLACLSKLGFKLMSQEANNKMFVTWVLKKQPEAKEPAGSIPWPTLKACVYKRR